MFGGRGNNGANGAAGGTYSGTYNGVSGVGSVVTGANGI